jgi:hypothetical protein
VVVVGVIKGVLVPPADVGTGCSVLGVGGINVKIDSGDCSVAESRDLSLCSLARWWYATVDCNYCCMGT